MNLHPSRHVRIPAVSTLLAAVLLTGLAPARGGSYYLRKDFSLQPPATEGLGVRGITYCHAFTSDKPKDGDACFDSDVNPTVQPGNWRPDQHDILAGYGSITVMNWGTNDAGKGEFIVANTNYSPFGRLGGTESFQAVADDCPSYALARSELFVDTFIGTNLIQGAATVSGTNYAVEKSVRHRAYAFSTAMIEAQGTNLVKGRLKAGPVYRVKLRGVQGHDARDSVKDPITFRVENPTNGVVTSGQFFRFILEGLPGQGGDVSWESNVMRVAVSDCSFRLDLPGRYTTAAGHLQLEVRNGVLLKADSGGVYAGMTPPLGVTIPFDFPLPNAVDLDYDLTSVAGTNAEVALELSAGGQVLEEFTADEPALSVAATGKTVTLAWPVSATPFELQSRRGFVSGPPWAAVGLDPVVEEGLARVTLPLGADPQFFRLFAKEAGPCELAVTTQPSDAFGGVGATVTWQVEASGAPAPNSFQWQQLNSEGAFVDIPGANEPLLTWTASPADLSAQFRCKIANGCSAVTSLPGKFTLTLD
ncbi:MAG TPA: hypothetical protein VI136_23610 [Verrucomicrobiae bacterium]